ncbi:MAG: hypothetical protein EBR09_17265, partial [Proteobacteria bacterium]|nr:hypothetical protein [Pseudomonadota bacterium]
SIPTVGGAKLERITSALGASPVTTIQLTAYGTGTESTGLISKTDRLLWTPPVNTNGRVTAFSVVALQCNSNTAACNGANDNQSVSTVSVNVSISRTNAAPTFSAVGTSLLGAMEDVPYIITYNSLLSNYAGTDSEPGVLTYRVSLLNSTTGTFKKISGGTPSNITFGVSANINPGESIEWTPVANAADTPRDLFDISLVDSEGAVSTDTRRVSAVVGAINDAPDYVGSTNLLTSTTKNVLAGRLITWDNVVAAVPATDVDGSPNDISYRIENIGSGIIHKGTAKTDSNLVVGPANTMPRLVKTGGNGTTTFDAVNWEPPQNGTGQYIVMTVRACDANDCSATTRDVQINVTGSNDAPVLATT